LAGPPVVVPDSYWEAHFVYPNFGNVVFDTDGFFNPSEYPDRILVPPALVGEYAIVKASCRWSHAKAPPQTRIQILPTRFNGSAGVDSLSGYPSCAPDNRFFIGGTTADHSSETHPIQLAEGDYFRCALWMSRGNGDGATMAVLDVVFSIRILR
jgi:hypothetical protein